MCLCTGVVHDEPEELAQHRRRRVPIGEEEVQHDLSQHGDAQSFSGVVALFYEGEDGGDGGGVWCMGADRDDVKL